MRFADVKNHALSISFRFPILKAIGKGGRTAYSLCRTFLRRCAYGYGEPGLMSVKGQTGPVSEPGCRTDQPSILRIGDAVEMAIYLIRMEKPRLMSTAFTAQH